MNGFSDGLVETINTKTFEVDAMQSPAIQINDINVIYAVDLFTDVRESGFNRFALKRMK